MAPSNLFPPSRRHLFLHLKIYQYTCRYCDKGFKLKHQLKTHEALHERAQDSGGMATVLRPTKSTTAVKKERKVELLCQFCGAKFTGNASLAKHMKKCTENVK